MTRRSHGKRGGRAFRVPPAGKGALAGAGVLANSERVEFFKGSVTYASQEERAGHAKAPPLWGGIEGQLSGRRARGDTKARGRLGLCCSDAPRGQPGGRGASRWCRLRFRVENKVSLLRSITNVSLRAINKLSTSCDFAILGAFRPLSYGFFIWKLDVKDEMGAQVTSGGWDAEDHDRVSLSHTGLATDGRFRSLRAAL